MSVRQKIKKKNKKKIKKKKTLRRIYGDAKLQIIILKSKCVVSKREMLLKMEKTKR